MEQAKCVRAVENYLTNSTALKSGCLALSCAFQEGCLHNDDDVITPMTWDGLQKKPIPSPGSNCCKKLYNTYTTRCNVKEYGMLSDQRLIAIILMLILSFFARSYVKSKGVTWLPEAAVCILCGMIGGFLIRYALVNFDFYFNEQLFLRVMLPPICFEAALAISKHEFRRLIGPILTFATVGTLVSTALTGIFVRWMSTSSMSSVLMPWPER